MGAATTRLPGVDNRQDTAGTKNAANKSPNGRPAKNAGDAIQRPTAGHPENTDTDRRGTGGDGVPGRHPGQNAAHRGGTSDEAVPRQHPGQDAPGNSGGNRRAAPSTSRAGATAIPGDNPGKNPADGPTAGCAGATAVPGNDPGKDSTAGAEMNVKRCKQL